MTGMPLDISGQVFGNLTAIEPIVGNIDRKRRWLCKCSCGEEEEIETYQLTSGSRVKCKIPQNHFNISVGDTFGKLTVEGFTHIPHLRRWKVNCSCSCGGSKSSLMRNFQRGCTTHCGCENKQRKLKQPAQTSLINRLIGSYKSNAKTRELVCDLTKEDFKILFKGDCYLCGKPPSRDFKCKNYEEVYTYSSIDRVDSKKGYELDNVKSCCTECNYLKSGKDLTEFLEQIYNIYHHQREE